MCGLVVGRKTGGGPLGRSVTKDKQRVTCITKALYGVMRGQRCEEKWRDAMGTVEGEKM